MFSYYPEILDVSQISAYWLLIFLLVIQAVITVQQFLLKRYFITLEHKAIIRSERYQHLRKILIGAKWKTWNDRNQHQQRLNRNKPSSLVRCRPWASFEAGPPVNDKKTVTTVILYTQKNIICIKISSQEITLYADFAFVGLQRIKWTKW